MEEKKEVLLLFWISDACFSSAVTLSVTYKGRGVKDVVKMPLFKVFY